MSDATNALERVIEEVVAPNAELVDRDGAFPRAAVDALGDAGILGVLSAEDVGGGGGDLGVAGEIVEQLARHCGSTAMVVLMHYAGVSVIEARGAREAREAIGAGRHLTTLAFSEAGSRSRFWSPMSTATAHRTDVVLDARKSWVTSAGEADSYVWSSRAMADPGPMTLWLVPSRTGGLEVGAPFDGLGLRGNASRPVTAVNATVPYSALLGTDGAGLDDALALVLPAFLVLNASASVGLMRATVDDTRAHLVSTRFEHRGENLASSVTSRSELARMQLETDIVAALVADTLAAIRTGREDAMLRVLEVKAAAAEAAVAVTDRAMRVCGGAAFRKELGIERRFRDACAARVMAPTTDALLDFVGRALVGMPLLDEANA